MRQKNKPLPSRHPISSGLFRSGGCGQAFDTLIVSGLFSGLSSLKRHRRVNAALKEEIAVIHAWSAKCQTPEEWERDKTAAAAAAATADSVTAPTGI
ncbi:hypothetical protein CDD80_5767 [Ophiocordyceps camponoti-rufipedis]|uniref:BolA protein n=1 Tax=Ophiocordyceps camponoti-rufipedis TaxID=2004952 RepID=A0A2C5YSZ6_9HYPO|nr:hypothetical protein CDD80_5767 [Ophiocordyceps camponoti-rufipedis]